MLKNLLIYRFAIFNLMMLTLLAVAYDRGLLGYVYGHDATGISVIITAVFCVAWLETCRRVAVTSRTLNALKEAAAEGVDLTTPRLVGTKVRAKVAWLHDVSGWLVGLGLIGTVVGFTVALSGIDQSSLAAASGVQVSMGKLMEGMRIALNTTITGAVLGMWNEVNHRMFRTALECLLADLGARP